MTSPCAVAFIFGQPQVSWFRPGIIRRRLALAVSVLVIVGLPVDVAAITPAQAKAFFKEFDDATLRQAGPAVAATYGPGAAGKTQLGKDTFDGAGAAAAKAIRNQILEANGRAVPPADKAAGDDAYKKPKDGGAMGRRSSSSPTASFAVEADVHEVWEIRRPMGHSVLLNVTGWLTPQSVFAGGAIHRRWRCDNLRRLRHDWTCYLYNGEALQDLRLPESEASENETILDKEASTMTSFEDVASVPHTFRGALAFNQRTVAGAVATVLGESPAGQSVNGTPMRLSELTNVLLVIESIAMSNGIFLDGTLPPKDIDRLSNELWRVKAQSGIALDVDFVRAPATALVSMFQQAAEAAALIIDDGLTRLDEQTDEPMGGDISEFLSSIRTAKEDRSGRAATELALGVAEAAAEGRETFRGSKCIAGIVLANREPVPLVDRAAQLLDANEATQRKAVAVLVNRFRINYVNSLASLRKAAYLADVAIEDLKSAQVVLFCRYLAHKISAEHANELSAQTRELFDHSLRAVPLGFAILMNSEGASPFAVLEEAMRMRDRSFCARAAHDTPQKRFLHQLTAEEFASFQDHLLRQAWTRLLKESELKEFMTCPWRSLRIPAAVGGIVSAAVGAVVAGPAGAVVGTAVGGAVGGAVGSVVGNLTQYLGEGIGSGTFGQSSVHVDQYRKLDRYFALAAKHDRVAQAFVAKVETLFQRKLDLPRPMSHE